MALCRRHGRGPRAPGRQHRSRRRWSVPLDGEVRAEPAPARPARTGRRRRRPGHRRRRRDAGRRRTPRRRAAGLRYARRPRPPATRATVGGIGRHQRRRRARAALRRHAPAAARASRRCSATGRVVRHLGGPEKDNTGYDLPSLLCGSEGTLGVVTAARLRLVARHDAPAWWRCVAFADVGAARGGGRRAWRDALECASRRPSCSSTPASTWCATPSAWPPPVRRPLAGLRAGRGAPATATPPTSWPRRVGARRRRRRRGRGRPTRPRAQALWRYREDHTEADQHRSAPPHKLDVTLPPRRLADFVAERAGARGRRCDPQRPDLAVRPRGRRQHPRQRDRPRPRRRAVDDAVLTSWPSWAAASAPSTASARAKARWLHLNRSARRAGRHAGHQAGPRPRRRPEPPRGAAVGATTTSRTGPPSRFGTVRDDPGARSSVGDLA